MSALTTETTFSDKRVGGLFSTFEEKVPVGASAVLYGGAIVGMLNGYAVSLAAFPQARPLGKAVGDIAGQGTGAANATVDNTGGLAGAKFVRVERGVFLMKNSAGVEALAETETGDPCYFVDDQTVSRHDAKGLRPLVGTFLGIDSGTSGCWVQIGVGPQAQVILTGLAGEDLSAHQYGAVKISAGGIVKCGDGQRAFGILQNAPANADVAKVCVFGPSLAVAPAAGFTTDLPVASDTNGLIVDAVAATVNTVTTVGAALVAPTAATVGADIGAFTDPPSAAEMALLRTFVNALKADMAARISNDTTAYTRVNELRVDILAVDGAAIDGDQALGIARETATVGQNKMIFVAPSGLI